MTTRLTRRTPLRPGIWLALFPLAAFPARKAWGQAPQTSNGTPRAALYTVDQAEQGSEIYTMNCSSCHPPITHTGPAFVATWNGRTVASLFRYIKGTMPKSDPGSLTETEYVRVLAYLLKLNGMPAGPTELPADVEALKLLRTDFPSGRDSTRSR